MFFRYIHAFRTLINKRSSCRDRKERQPSTENNSTVQQSLHAMSENYFLHVLPWVTVAFTIFLFLFMFWVGYYSYEGTKLQNPRKSQSVTTLVFASIFGLVAIFLFIWAVFHLSQLYSKEKKVVPASAATAALPLQQEATVAQPRPVGNLNNFSSSSSITSGNTSAAAAENVGTIRTSYSGNIYDSPAEPINISKQLSS